MDIVDEKRTPLTARLVSHAVAGVRKKSASRGQIAVLSVSSFVFLLLVVREQTELTRLAALNHLLLQSTQQKSFKFRSTTLTSLNGSSECVSTEVNEGDFLREVDGTYSAHVMTTTEVKYPKRGAKMMQAERLFDRGEAWIRYHQTFPDRSPGGHPTIGGWQSLEEIVSDALAAVSGHDGDTLTRGASEMLRDSPSADLTSVFPLFKDESTKWVGKQRRKGSLRCFDVDLYPGALLETDTLAFEFTGPGEGISKLGDGVVRGSRVWVEYCFNRGGLIESMMLEAVAGGWWGFHFRKEVEIQEYNKRVEFPAPNHQQHQGKQDRTNRFL
ncbi:hypothetical protein BSKO_11316 [Bryopsis sp. KO-2023]|nr:hypothetical protein BSKO_11316 [Bryopsis sp. KO-2023]